MLCMGGGILQGLYHSEKKTVRKFMLFAGTAAPAAPGDVVCSTQIADFGGVFDQGSGTISSTLQSGRSVSAEWSATKTTNVGTDMTASITV